MQSLNDHIASNCKEIIEKDSAYESLFNELTERIRL